MKYIFSVLLVTGLLSVLSNCTSSKKASAAGRSEQFYMHRWNLVELQGQSSVATTDTSKAPHLLFYSGQVNQVKGSTGCNRLTGTFELSGVNKISFSPIATTKMLCSGNNSQIETSFLNALQQVNNYYFTGNNLMLLNGRMLMAKLEATPAE